MSKNQKNNYPLEFKISSAQLALDSNQPIAKTARDLDVNHNTLHGWIEKYSDFNPINQNNMSNSNKAFYFEENKRLKKELALVKREERDLLKKAARVLCKRVSARYAWIKENSGELSILVLCKFMKVSRSDYYDWLDRPESSRSSENKELTKQSGSVQNSVSNPFLGQIQFQPTCKKYVQLPYNQAPVLYWHYPFLADVFYCDEDQLLQTCLTGERAPLVLVTFLTCR